MKTPGKYAILVRELHRAFGDSHRYRLELVDEQPAVIGSIAKDVFVGEVGKPIEIEIAVERTHGCADEAAFRVEGLAEGIVCESVISRSGDDSAKKATLKVTANQACSIPIQVRIDQAGRAESAYAVSGPHRQSNLWLIVKPSP